MESPSFSRTMQRSSNVFQLLNQPWSGLFAHVTRMHAFQPCAPAKQASPVPRSESSSRKSAASRAQHPLSTKIQSTACMR